MYKICVFLLLLNSLTLTGVSIDPAVVGTKKMDRVATFGAGDQNYHLKRPRSLLFLPDNRIVIAESQNLLLVSANGNLRKKLYKKGQGPGEFVWVNQVTRNNKQLIVLSSMPKKLVYMDHNGTFVKENKFKSQRLISHRLIDTFKQQLIFHVSKFPTIRGNKDRFVTSLEKIELFDPTKKNFKNLGNFEVKKFTVFRNNRPTGTIDSTVLRVKPYLSKYLVLHHSELYIVKIMNLETKKIARIIQPKYNRVPEPPDFKYPPVLLYKNEEIGHPKREYFNDVEGLFTDEKYIYILTSTKDKKGRSRVDVYNSAFKLTKQLYLDQKKGILDFNDGSVFLREEDEEGNYVIGKYKIR